MQTKNFRRTILVFGLILGCSFVASSQIKVVSSGELNESVSAANQKARQLSHKVVQIDETLVDGAVIKTVETITRQVPDVGTHTRTRTTEGDSVMVDEWIYINESYYHRANGGSWKKDTDGVFRRLEILIGPQPPSLGQHTVDTQKGLLESLSIAKKGDELVFVEFRTWIGRDGRPSFQARIEGKLSPRIETFRSTSQYEYNPSIVVEAPIK